MSKLKSECEVSSFIDNDIIMEENNITSFEQSNNYDKNLDKFIFNEEIANKLSKIVLTESKSLKEVKDKLCENGFKH